MLLKKTYYDIEVEKQVGEYLQWVVEVGEISSASKAIRIFKNIRHEKEKNTKMRLIEVTRKIIKL